MRFLESAWGVDTFLEHDDASNMMVERRTQDVAAILDNNKALQTLNDGYSPSREFRRIASIPLVVWAQWEREGITKDQAALRRRLNDPDNRFFRTSVGRV